MNRDSNVFVTDTHPLIYYADRRFSKLSKRARALFDRANEGTVVIYVPSIVLAEVTILIRPNRLRLPFAFDKWCRDIESSDGFLIEPLLWTDVNETRDLPFEDPFDRLIAGTALRLQLPLITKDVEIADSELVETVW